MIEFWSEYIEIEVEYTHRARDIVHICIDLVLVLDAYDIADEPRLYSGEYIVAHIAREIGEFPGILCISGSSIELKMILIVPEIRVFINMYEFKSYFYYSSSHRITPEVEGMIMIVEYHHILTHLYKIPESYTWSEDAIFYLFEDNIFSDAYIR